ncbi:DUF2628 domain-containing protein [Lutibaculum baratangense]|nr:DUF2628 domain-containing protein [Lutibaculum baratangense]
MKTYTVHRRRDAFSSDDEEARIILVKEGFNWPALFFPLIWLLFRRMWLVTLAWLAVTVLIGVLGSWLGEAHEGSVTIVTILVSIWFAFEANALRRWSLGRKGWEIVDIVSGEDRWQAELSHFRRAETAVPFTSAASPHGAGRRARGVPVVGGLFPEAGR